MSGTLEGRLSNCVAILDYWVFVCCACWLTLQTLVMDVVHWQSKC